MYFLGSIVSTLALAAIARSAPTQATTQDKAFDSCRDISSDRAVLTATCDDGDGGFRRTTINLNDCFTNDNGVVRPVRGGNFASSCTAVIDPGDHSLSGMCAQRSGSVNWYSIDLNRFLTNREGILTCDV